MLALRVMLPGWSAKLAASFLTCPDLSNPSIVEHQPDVSAPKTT